MPRNRAEVAREVKVDEIVEAARRRLVDGDYASLSMAALARDLDVAQAAIYWYFPSKDHLFVAAVDRIFHDVLGRKPRGGTCLDHVIWFMERLQEFQVLRMALRERARVADVAAEFDRDMSDFLNVMLANAIRPDVPPELLDDAVDTVMALCEGVLAQPLSKRRRREVVRFGYERIVPQS